MVAAGELGSLDRRPDYRSRRHTPGTSADLPAAGHDRQDRPLSGLGRGVGYLGVRALLEENYAALMEPRSPDLRLGWAVQLASITPPFPILTCPLRKASVLTAT